MTGHARSLFVALLMGVAVWSAPALAVQPDEVLSDPALEQRARTLSEKLRCMVCQNQSIDDSDADLARDLRILVRDRLEAGDSNEEVLDFIVARYGEFVLLKPRLTARNALLWAAPLLLLILGGGILYVNARAPRRSAPQALNEEEQAKLDHILKNRD